MSTQIGLRDVESNTAMERRALAMRKSAAPPMPRRATAMAATFISPPRNTPLAAHNVNHIHAYVQGKQQGVTAQTEAAAKEGSRSKDSLQPPMADYNIPTMMTTTATAMSVYPQAAVLGPQLRTIDNVPVLSMRNERPQQLQQQQQQSRYAAAVPALSAHNTPPPPTSTPMSRQPLLPTTTTTASCEDDIVVTFLTTYLGRVAEMACTPMGKSLLVSALETERMEVLEPVVAELCEHLPEVAVDAQGCHVLRILVEAATAEQTETLMHALYPSDVLNICTTSQHTRLTLQSLFERRLVDLWPIVEVMASNAGYLAATQQGCISLMRVFERCDVEQKAALVEELLPKFATLSLDAFANYMVQCAIEHSDRTTGAQYVVQHFAGNLLRMSCDKFASNVVEKVVRICGGVPAVRRLLLDELIFNPAALKELVSDGFGNFVVQAIVEATTNAMELKRIEDRLRPLLDGCPYAAKIEAKLKSKRPGQPQTNGSNRHHGAQQQQPQQQRNAHRQQQQQGYGSRQQSHVGAGYRVEDGGRIHGNAQRARYGGMHTEATALYYASERRQVPATAAAAVMMSAAETSYVHSNTASPAAAQIPILAGRTMAPVEVREQQQQQIPVQVQMQQEGVAVDSAPVYGPSPAARRHLQMQQPFRPPFTGTL